MDMASCNNCSLKEKEQVYTAARDGNLMYLKVSEGFRTVKIGTKKPWNFYFLFILIRFSGDFFCCRIFRALMRLKFSQNVIDFESICSVGLRMFDAKISIDVFNSPKSTVVTRRCVCEIVVFFYYQRRRLSHFLTLFFPTISLCGNFYFEGSFFLLFPVRLSTSISIFNFTQTKRNVRSPNDLWKLIMTCRDFDIRL